LGTPNEWKIYPKAENVCSCLAIEREEACKELKENFMISWKGKRYVLYAGLLEEAHTKGLRSIDTEVLQLPIEENGNVAILKASVELEDGRSFTGIGDASPSNVGRAIAPHIIRMAETRAKARALRDAVNVGVTALEELSDTDDALRAPQPIRKANKSKGMEDSAGEEPKAAPEASTPSSIPPNSEDTRTREASSTMKARKSQIDLLRTLAQEIRGEDGVERLEERIGKALSDLTRSEAEEWIERLTPQEGS
jgi:hypothetical protein